MLHALQKIGVSLDQLGIVVVDHGSRLEESNRRLFDVVDIFRSVTGHHNVHPAHMELARPTVEEAFDQCVGAGATWVVVHPFFLLPGRHWTEDIPRLADRAAARHPDVQHLVSAPLGAHELMAQLMHHRITTCLEHAAGLRTDCELCDGSRCRIRL